MKRLEVETDCQVLVNLWENPSCQNSEVGPLLQQVYDRSWSFVDFTFVFSSRTLNKLAHKYAKLVSHTNLEEWLVPPPGLPCILDAECNHVHR